MRVVIGSPTYNLTADAAFSLNVCPERRVMVT
jgi:hypothetical protein